MSPADPIRSNLEAPVQAPDRPIQDLFCIEIFAGTGRLTAALKSLGLRHSFGVDSKLPPKLRSPIVKYDLLNSDHVDIVKSLIAKPECIFVHFAPPCGTSSRARLIQRRGRYNPPILRTETHPNGIPGLTGTLLARVLAANELYAVTCKLVKWCIQHDTYFAVENPGRSFMWDTDPFRAIMQAHPCYQVTFHHCQYGSSRRKLTRFWHNISTFQSLQAYCQNDHAHEPWGQNPSGHWNTSEETAYPWDLCRSIGAKLLLQLKQDGFQCSAPVFALQEASLNTMRASTDLQPRRGIPPMVSEFKTLVQCSPTDPKPPNSRPLSTPPRGADTSAQSVTYGVHRTPEEFAAEALQLGHPTRIHTMFPDEMREVVSHVLSKTVGDLAKERMEEIKRWIQLAADLAPAEEELKSQMSVRRRKILQNKKLVLTEMLLRDAGHSDTEVIKDLTSGFDLTGMLPESGVFAKNVRPATISCQELRNVADLSRKGMMQTVKSSGDVELDQQLHDATMKEVQKGFLVGPVKLAELPSGATLTRRFGVKQKNKTRPIDDYKASLVNSSVTQTESATVHTMDHIAALVACVLREAEAGRSSVTLEAKTWDLAHAYKQVPLSDSAYDADSFLVVYNPNLGQAEIFQQKVLPFGSIASVTAFLRISHALWKLGAKLLHLLWSSYFDDFFSITEAALSKHTELIITSFFNILGWDLSSDKLIPYESVCKVLGVQFDFKMSGEGWTVVTNTKDRVDELCEAIEEILEAGTLRRGDGEKLRGRLLFASGQLFGRRARNLVRKLSMHVQSNCKLLNEETILALKNIHVLLTQNLPRKIKGRLSTHLHVYVDASFDEDGYSGVGGVAYDEYGIMLGFFSEKVSDDLIKSIKEKGQVTIIQELEMLALLVAVELWSPEWDHCRFVAFTDSESVRCSFLKSWSMNETNNRLLERVFKVEEESGCQIWLERVPSQSNPSDYLSRQLVAKWHNKSKTDVCLDMTWKRAGQPPGVMTRPA